MEQFLGPGLPVLHCPRRALTWTSDSGFGPSLGFGFGCCWLQLGFWHRRGPGPGRPMSRFLSARFGRRPRQFSLLAAALSSRCWCWACWGPRHAAVTLWIWCVPWDSTFFANSLLRFRNAQFQLDQFYCGQLGLGSFYLANSNSSSSFQSGRHCEAKHECPLGCPRLSPEAFKTSLSPVA